MNPLGPCLFPPTVAHMAGKPQALGVCPLPFPTLSGPTWQVKPRTLDPCLFLIPTLSCQNGRQTLNAKPLPPASPNPSVALMARCPLLRAREPGRAHPAHPPSLDTDSRSKGGKHVVQSIHAVYMKCRLAFSNFSCPR